VFSDGVVEIYRNSEIFVEQIALMLHRVVGLVGDDKVVTIGEPRGDGIFAAAAHESKERTEEQKYMFHRG
jgi:hypothetical protein